MGNKLCLSQFNVLGQSLAANIKREASIRGKGNDTNASTWLTVIGVGRSAVDLAGMLGAELMGQTSHGGSSGTVFLEESHVCMPGGKPIGVGLKVGDILGLNDGDARWRRWVEHGVRQGMHKSATLRVALGARWWRAGWHSLLG